MKSVQTKTTIAPAERQCPRCGARLGGYGPEGLCSACLISGALDDEEEVPSVAAPRSQLRSLGDYELLEEIARGGMGVVYRARQVSLDRIVALKMILGGELAGPDEVSRFRQEAEAAARLKHPNIVAIHEVGERDGQHFFSMDFIEGRTLRQLTRDNPLSAQRAAECLKAVAEAVHYAHQQGVVHRDLKPGNVLVDAAGQPHVTDFGLAKRIGSDADLTRSGDVMGTPGYMPPEQASGRTKTVGPLADVYALGALLYDLLTGRPPFRGETPVETMGQVMKAEPVAPRLLNASVPRDLETICLKCLEKEPARRYASARELALDLGRFLNHEPIHAAPPSALDRTRKFVRRHRLAVAVAVCFVLVLTTATVVSMRFGFQADAERKAALKAQGEAQSNADEKESVLSFVENKVLSAPRPEGVDGGLGREVTLRRAVQAAEADIPVLFTNQPKVELMIRKVIGTTHVQLGEFTNAIAHFDKALELSRMHLGPEHPRTVELMYCLGTAYSRADRPLEAIPLHQEAVRLAELTGGPEDLVTLRYKNGLALAYKAARKFPEAVSLLEELERKSRGQHDANLRIGILGNLASAYQQSEQVTNVLPLFEQSLELSRAHYGQDHPYTLSSEQDLLTESLNRRDVEAVLPRLERIVELNRELMGPDHVQTLRSQLSLAVAYGRVGRLTNAIELGEQTVELSKGKLGPEHHITLISMVNLASQFRNANRRTDALALVKQAYEVRLASLGPDHDDTVFSLCVLSQSYNGLRRYEEATPLLEEAIRQTRKHIKPGFREPIELRAMMEDLAKIRLSQRRYKDLIELEEAMLTLEQPHRMPDHPNTLEACNLLAAAYHHEGRTREAITLLERSLTSATEAARTNALVGARSLAQYRRGYTNAVLRTLHNVASYYQLSGNLVQALAIGEEMHNQARVLAPTNDVVIEGLKRLIEAYTTTNDLRRAAALLGELAEVQRLDPTNGTWNLGKTLSRLGEAFLRLGRFAEAEPVLRERIACLSATERETSVGLAAQGVLGQALLGQRKYAEAEKELLEAQRGLKPRDGENLSPSGARALDSVVRRLVELYEAWGKPDEAKRWREKTN